MKTTNKISNRQKLTFASILSLLLVLFITFESFAKKEEFSKTFKEEYKVNSDALLLIKNKFGEVNCQNWNENKVSIKVTISVEASNEDKAQRVFDKINVKLSGSSSKVEGITEMKEGSNFNNVDFSIDYMIMLPKSMDVELQNKFGEIIVDEVDGTSDIYLAYGELEANALNSASNSIVIKFSEASIGYVSAADIEIAYSELDIDGSETLDLDTKFSEVDITRVGNIKITSQYDDYNIEKMGPVECEAKFTDISVDVQKGHFTYDIQYGELDVDYVELVEGKCMIYTSFGDVSLGISNQAAFRLDAEAKFGSVDYPGGNTDIRHSEEGYTTNVYTGTFGDNPEEGNVLYIRSKNASVSLD